MSTFLLVLSLTLAGVTKAPHAPHAPNLKVGPTTGASPTRTVGPAAANSPGLRIVPTIGTLAQDVGPTFRSSASQERIVEIRIQGNYRTSEEDVRRIAAVQVGDLIGADTLDGVRTRLQRSGKFENVETRKRWRTIDSTEDIVLLIIVREAQGGSSNALGRLARSLARPLVLPVINYADGYGLTYGARLSPVNLLGQTTQVSIPVTWGATKQAAFEVDRPLARGPLTRVATSVAINERHNPFHEEDDRRMALSARAERALGPLLRAGISGTASKVSFGGSDQQLTTWGADAAVDTRKTRDLPRNAVHVRFEWDRLRVGGDSIDRYRADARGYIGMPGASVLALRGLRADASAALPSYEQFLLGGTSSVRGFRTGYRAGDRLVMGSAEWRVPLSSPVSFGRAGVTLFADTGTVYAAGERLRDARMRTGIGAGLFFNAAIFNLNLDVARGLERGVHVHVTSGLQF